MDETVDLSPEDVRFKLSRLDSPALLVIDELDRLEDDEALTGLADTVKTLSDHAVESTLVLVGVAGLWVISLANTSRLCGRLLRSR